MLRFGFLDGVSRARYSSVVRVGRGLVARCGSLFARALGGAAVVLHNWASIVVPLRCVRNVCSWLPR
jgi:hypothetical protein